MPYIPTLPLGTHRYILSKTHTIPFISVERHTIFFLFSIINIDNIMLYKHKKKFTSKEHI